MAMKMLSLVLAGAVAIIGSCTNSTPTPGSVETSAPSVGPTGSPTVAVDDRRVGVYEAMIRELVLKERDALIAVNAELCSYLRGGRCNDRIVQAEQDVLATRLQDLGQVVFVDGLGRTSEEGTRRITLLGPIIDAPDGLRVEGGYWCGSLCAGGAMYIVERTDSGYKVVGTDPSYGSWIS